ncbi:MAG: 4Fe-4S binding protein, partial [Candidatus Omnitrophica bacterium]|nr:4Fe-4S binding protein [Candidatus Omnitrophota bacterium]
MPIQIIIEKCAGCALCIKACPFDAIRMMDKKAMIDLNICTLCGACVNACKFKAILLEKTPAKCELPDTKGYKGIWVFIEQKKGKVQSVSYELLGKARELADKLDTDVSSVFIGHNIDDQIDELIYCGSDKIYLVEAPEVADFQDEPYTNILVELINKYKPEILLCGATAIGRSLVSRVAVKIKAGLTADCTGLDIDPDKKILLQTRPAFGGNIMATIISPNHRPQMATVRHKVFQPLSPDHRRKGTVIRERFSSSVFTSRTKFWLPWINESRRQVTVGIYRKEPGILSEFKEMLPSYDPYSIIKDSAKGKFQFNIPSFLNKLLKYLFKEI